jgi:hypothetical protein
VADELGLDHQICRKYVKDNVDALANDLFAQLKDEEPVPDGVAASPAILQWI